MISTSVFVLLAFAVGVCFSASCTTTNNADYSNAGNLVTLYGVTSATQCCTACSGFEECKYWSWTSSNSQCYPKNQQSTQVSASGVVGGVNTGGSYSRNISTTCNLDVGYEYYYTGGSLATVSTKDASSCCSACQGYVGCNYYVYKSGTCYLQASQGLRRAASGITSGTVLPDFKGVTPRTGKRGLGVYGTNSCSDIKKMTKISWAYNWSPQPGVLEGCYKSLGIEFVPMMWGLNRPVGDLYTKSKYLLTFNEPNFGDQSNMTPQQAAQAWPAIQSWAQQYNILISSPSASYGGSNMGDAIAWLDQFFGNCTGCKVDFIATHQYDCNAYNLYGATTNFKKYGKPIWVTEFGCFGSSSSSDLVSWANTLLPLFDKDGNYTRYAYFGSRANTNYVTLDPTQNALTPMGVTYNS